MGANIMPNLWRNYLKVSIASRKAGMIKQKERRSGVSAANFLLKKYRARPAQHGFPIEMKYPSIKAQINRSMIREQKRASGKGI